MWIRIPHFKGYKIDLSVKKNHYKNRGLFRKITVGTKIRKNIVLVQNFQKEVFKFS